MMNAPDRTSRDSDGCTLTPVEFDACLEHDLDYTTGRVTRREADRKLFDAIYPVSPGWAWIYWLAVRIGGASRYRHDARAEPAPPGDQVRDV
jgi:hypothetical protein